MDLRMPDLDGAHATARILAQDPNARILVLTTFDTDEDVYRALCATCPMSIDPIDCATTSFMIRGIRRRDLGTVTQTLKRLLKRYHFDQTATLTRR
jgi:CheY-like chemotaxis protein